MITGIYINIVTEPITVRPGAPPPVRSLYVLRPLIRLLSLTYTLSARRIQRAAPEDRGHDLHDLTDPGSQRSPGVRLQSDHRVPRIE